MRKNILALGRLKVGAMNKTEAAYAAHLEMLRRGAALVAMLCGGAMLGRALLLTLRVYHANRVNA